LLTDHGNCTQLHRASLSVFPKRTASRVESARVDRGLRLEGTMRVIFVLPPLLVATAAVGGLFAPFAVGGVPTDSKGIAATERLFGTDIPICHGSGTGGMARAMRLAQTRTEVPQAEMQAASPAAAFASTDP